MDSGVTKTQKIVTKPLKIDFHIHSSFSKYKDELDLVKDGTKENIELLLEKLKDNGIEMCAITDHDYFSYELYSTLKKHENENKLLKVFPGVEFSVGLKGDDGIKQIHVICIFDDEDEDKVKHINECIPFKNEKIDYDTQEKFFSEEKFISILRDIDLNVITIAHQKQSITSSSATKSKNDATSLGETKFNELISCEYFESFEFKNMKNGMFNKVYSIQKNKNYDHIRFITGSDCHDWNVYPKHDIRERNDINFSFTYLKCLPTFRGLAMAFSDTRRISTSDYIFTSSSKKLDKIQLSINNEDFDIELSPGINVIIGDNSIGKSLLIHKLIDYKYLSDRGIKNGYDDYLKRNNIRINTYIKEENIHTFDKQGGIRERFSNDNQDNSEFLKDKFPDDHDVEKYKAIIHMELDKMYKCLENKFQYDEKYKELNSLVMVDEQVESKSLTVRKIDANQKKINKYKGLKKYYDGIITKIDEGYSKVEDTKEKEVIDSFRDKIVSFRERYDKLAKIEEEIYFIKTNINNAIKDFNNEIKSLKTDLEIKKNKFEVEDSTLLSDTIADLVKLEKGIKKFKFDIKEVPVKPEVLNYGKYSFIKKFNNCSSINNDYLNNVVKSVIRKKAQLDTSIINKEELKQIILNVDEDELVLDAFVEKINEKIDDDLKIIPGITQSNKDVYNKLSNGMNSTIYFDILSEDQKEGIYIVDQPEDDISQNAIKSNVLDNFKTMSNNRQIIMITHNPQFVVNLDVDNVICLTKDKDNNIVIKSGALEYVGKDNEVDILNCVAQNLDGGIESIRKRWKRYEKTVSVN